MNIDKKVLLLNNSYEPIQIIGGKKSYNYVTSRKG